MAIIFYLLNTFRTEKVVWCVLSRPEGPYFFPWRARFGGPYIGYLPKLLEIIYPFFLKPHAHQLGHGFCPNPLLIEIDGRLVPLHRGKWSESISVANPLTSFQRMKQTHLEDAPVKSSTVLGVSSVLSPRMSLSSWGINTLSCAIFPSCPKKALPTPSDLWAGVTYKSWSLVKNKCQQGITGKVKSRSSEGSLKVVLSFETHI